MKNQINLVQTALENDEPVIAFRAQDNYALETIEYYRYIMREGGDAKFMLDLDKRINEFRDWKMSNPEKMKNPD